MLEVLWFVLFGLDVLLLVRLRRKIRLRPSTPDVELTAYEAACLVGGRNRVIETAVAKLLDDGRLRATRAAGLVRVEGVKVEDPVDVAVLSGLRTPTPLSTVVSTCRDTEKVLAIVEELSALGLCTTDRDRASVKEFYWHLLILGSLWIPITLTSTIYGPGLLVSIVLVLYAISIASGVSTLTNAGEDLAARVRSGKFHVPEFENKIVAAVALRGLRVYPDGEARAAAYSRSRQSQTRSSCSSSSCGGGGCSSSSCSSVSDSGSSSCGSSSSCGGGSSCSSSS